MCRHLTIAQTPLIWERKRIVLSVAYGTHGLAADEDPQQAMAAADRAMYQQKRERGRGRADPP